MLLEDSVARYPAPQPSATGRECLPGISSPAVVKCTWSLSSVQRLNQHLTPDAHVWGLPVQTVGSKLVDRTT